MAKQVGVTKSTIAAYENDSRQPSYEVLIKLADIFRVSIDYILLNRSENILDAQGLTDKQTELVNILICQFRKDNLSPQFSDDSFMNS